MFNYTELYLQMNTHIHQQTIKINKNFAVSVKLFIYMIHYDTFNGVSFWFMFL